MIVRYGEHRSQFGELAVPPGEGRWPVAVVIHGGCWRTRYDLHLMDAVCADLARRGWAAWNVEYRRVGPRGGGGWPATFDDVEAAIERLASPAGARIDPGRIVAIGHSAGGQLALWAAARGLVCAAVGQAAVSDLDAAARDGVCGGMPQRLLGGAPGDVPERYASASPARLLPLPVPALLVHGERDDVVPVGMSRAVAARAGCDLEVVAGEGHFEHLEPGSRAWATVVEWLSAT
jgi:acetyl esterase/lipase